MSIQEYNSVPTTNDLLESRIAENALAATRDSNQASTVAGRKPLCQGTSDCRKGTANTV
jgi:hypothetical protein